MKRRDLLGTEELSDLNFLALCKETMEDFKRRQSGRAICFSIYDAMYRVTNDK